jgi:HlyD family secretion protein
LPIYKLLPGSFDFMPRPDRRIIGLWLVTLTGLAACSKQTPEQAPIVSVQTAVVEQGPIQETIRAEAILYPKNQAAITPKIAAPVRRFYVNRGSHVRQGQVLAELENRDLAAAVTDNEGVLQQAQAAYETTTAASLPEDLKKAELDVASAREALDAEQKLYDSRQYLYKQGALPRKELDQAGVSLVQAKAQFQIADQHLVALQTVGKPQTTKSAAGQLTSARGKYEGAAAQLGYTEIRSPIDGVVTERPGYPGETPPQGVPILTVMDISYVIAKVHVPQEQAALLKVGDTATISGRDTSVAESKVSLVSPTVDPNSTTVEVWVETKNATGALRPGSTVQVEIVARKVPDAITIPAAALLTNPAGGISVMVVGTDHKAHRTEVEVGIRNADMVQITKGLPAGQTVVTVGAYGLPDNTQVKPVQLEKQGSAPPESSKSSTEKD